MLAVAIKESSRCEPQERCQEKWVPVFRFDKPTKQITALTAPKLSEL
jgi:hypothetical protein